MQSEKRAAEKRFGSWWRWGGGGRFAGQPGECEDEEGEADDTSENPCSPGADQGSEARAAGEEGVIEPEGGGEEFEVENSGEEQQAPKRVLRPGIERDRRGNANSYFLRRPLRRSAAPATSVRALPAEEGSISGETPVAIATEAKPRMSRTSAESLRIVSITFGGGGR